MNTDELMYARTSAGVNYATACHVLAEAYIELRAIEEALQNATFGMSHTMGPTVGTEGPHFPAHPKFLRDRLPGSPNFRDRIHARLEALLKPAPVPSTPAAATETAPETTTIAEA